MKIKVRLTDINFSGQRGQLLLFADSSFLSIDSIEGIPSLPVSSLYSFPSSIVAPSSLFLHLDFTGFGLNSLIETVSPSLQGFFDFEKSCLSLCRNSSNVDVRGH